MVFFLGLVAYWLQQNIRINLEKPKITAQLRSIVIMKNKKGLWEFTSYIKLANSGKTPASIQYKSAQLLFSHAEKPFHFLFDKFINLPSNTILEDTLSSQFPFVFEAVMDSFPDLKNGVFQTSIPSGATIKTIKFDSTDILYNFDFIKYRADFKKLREARYDSVKNEATLAVKKVYVNYKGKNYLNFVYPRSINVDYKMVDDKIELNYFQGGNTFKLSKGFSAPIIMEPTIFFPHPSLKSKVLFPEKIEATIFIETKKEAQIIYDGLKLYLGTDQRQIIYIFKH